MRAQNTHLALGERLGVAVGRVAAAVVVGPHAVQRPVRAAGPARLGAERQVPAPGPLVDHVEEVEPGRDGRRGGGGGGRAWGGRGCAAARGDRGLGARVGGPRGDGRAERVVVAVLVGVLAVGAAGDGALRARSPEG